MAQIPLVIEQSLKDYLDDLARDYHLNHVLLFGSLAQGKARPDSDIDLAIFSTDATDDNRHDIMVDCWLRTRPYKLDIQPLVFPLADFYDTTNDFIQKEIIGRGLEINVEHSNV